jgi:hypothetical protein
MNEISQDALMSFGIVVWIFLLIGAVIITVLAILMPIYVYLIHSKLQRLDTRFHSHCKTIETEALLHTKLLADIRKALQSMEAVGIEVEQQPEPQYTPPSVPQSIGPRRHQIRTS